MAVAPGTIRQGRPSRGLSAITDFLVVIGRGAGVVVGALYQAGRDAVDQVLRNILPFMCFISFVIGLILYTGIGNLIAHTVAPLASNPVGLVVMGILGGLPFLSPVLGPGAVMAQVIGTLLGVEIGLGHIPVQFALPAFFAINSQVGCDFIPVGLALGEAEPETVEVGVPAVLFSRQITGPIAVIIAYFASFGLYAGYQK
jgi:PTS system glucitol/sorbitol-specific IIC component